MILDTSVIAAILLNEPNAGRVRAVLGGDELSMSAVNYGELRMLVLKSRPEIIPDVARFVAELGIEIVAADEGDAIVATDAKERFRINLGDCFCYALARRRGLPILTLDADFAKTDARLVAF